VTSPQGHIFSTHDLPARDQFAAWVGWFHPVFDVTPQPEAERLGFRAETRIWPLGQVALSRVRAPHIRVLRGAQNLRRDPVDHWNVTIGEAETRLVCAGRERIIPAHTPFVISLGETIESERGADERLQLYLPRDHFGHLAPLLDGLRGVALLGAHGQLLAEYLRLLGRSIPDLTVEDLPRLQPAIQAMLQACLEPAAPRPEAAQAQTDLTRMEQIRSAIRRLMHRATLNATALCREVGMSRSQLYRLLEGEGGVVRYIQRLRLLAAHAALCDVGDTRSIAAIAEGTGFYDPSAFSRAFRREFGLTPSDLRAAGRAGCAPGLGLSPVMRAETATLSGYLRGR
jgi:AraC-like DNA-binding protein